MKTFTITVALGAIIAAAPALAQAPGPQGGGFQQRDQTRAEAQQRADMMFQMLDANKDGTVTKAEAEQALAQSQSMQAGGQENGRAGGRARMMQRMIDQLFAASTSITQQQFETLMLTRFDAMDLNHDGVVTAAERQQYREQREAQRAGGAPGAPVPQPPTPQ